MEPKILDLSFLYDLSDNDPVYINDVINLFIDIVPEGIAKLEKLVAETDDYDAIHKQAHFLKSSANIIKIKDVYDDLARISVLSRERMGKEEIVAKMENIMINFKVALPLLMAEKGKYGTLNKKNTLNIKG